MHYHSYLILDNGVITFFEILVQPMAVLWRGNNKIIVKLTQTTYHHFWRIIDIKNNFYLQWHDNTTRYYVQLIVYKRDAPHITLVPRLVCVQLKIAHVTHLPVVSNGLIFFLPLYYRILFLLVCCHSFHQQFILTFLRHKKTDRIKICGNGYNLTFR